MKTIITFLSVALLVLSPGCGKKAPDQGGLGADSETPEVLDAATLDKLGDEELAEPNKAEARQWLKAPGHALFEGDRESVIKFVDECYAAGATTIYVTGIENLGGTEVTASLLMVLPKEAAPRAKLFEISNRFNETIDSSPDKDVGQKYLTFGLD